MKSIQCGGRIVEKGVKGGCSVQVQLTCTIIVLPEVLEILMISVRGM